VGGGYDDDADDVTGDAEMSYTMDLGGGGGDVPVDWVV
jgi:hypothetical protein